MLSAASAPCALALLAALALGAAAEPHGDDAGAEGVPHHTRTEPDGSGHHTGALEALAELRDEPVMLEPSAGHHYKPRPPDKAARPLTRWERRGAFVTPEEDRLACCWFAATKRMNA